MNQPVSKRLLFARAAGIAAGLAGLGLSAACGPDAQPEAKTAATSAPAKAPVPILAFNWAGPEHRFSLANKAVLDDFQTRNPGRVTIDVGEGAAGVNLTKIKASVAANTPPNLWSPWQVEASDLFSLGALVDLNAELRTHKDFGKLKGEVIPTLVDGATWKGKLTLMPMFPDPHGLGYNKQHLVQAGVALPKQGYTWDDFVAIGRRAAQPPDRVLFNFEYTWNMFLWWMYANGQRPLTADRTKVLFDTPQVLQTLEWLHEQVTRTQLARHGKADFNEGKSVTEVINAGTVTPPRYPNVDPGDGTGISLTHYPLGPSNTKKEIGTSGNVFGFVVFKSPDANKVAAAAEIAVWSVRPDVQLKVSEASGHAPANLTAAKDPNLSRALKGNLLLNTLNDLAKYNYPTPNFPNWGQANTILNENLGRLAKGELRAKEALAEIQAKIQELVDEDLRRG
ncbi:MAG: extracellular solute-binding protein [Chloroflexi bacterium]|nr:extracellular solute-binding protein [Chloroflexota bacterium]